MIDKEGGKRVKNIRYSCALSLSEWQESASQGQANRWKVKRESWGMGELIKA